MFWICILLFSLQYVDVTAVPQFFKLQLPSGVIGPEALAFDKRGRGPYMGVADGRILKFQGPTGNFREFATTSPNRTKEQCDGINDLNLAPVCGRPVGLGFNYHTGDLYIVDAGFGLMVVGKDGGLATQIASGINGTAFGLADALDIDQASGIVYFTDTGPIFKLTSNATAVILSGDTSGRLLKYDPRSKQVTLLLDGLSGATGVAISADGAYLLISEFIALRIRRFWLKGPMANSADVFTTLEGSPDNIKRNILGDFWVSVNVVNQETSSVLALGQRINALGNVVASLNFTTLYGTLISEVHEAFGRLYIGSLFQDFIGVYMF